MVGLYKSGRHCSRPHALPPWSKRLQSQVSGETMDAAEQAAPGLPTRARQQGDMMPRRWERWWRGYLIHLEEVPDGVSYKVRREIEPAARRESWLWEAGPFPGHPEALTAAAARIRALGKGPET